MKKLLIIICAIFAMVTANAQNDSIQTISKHEYTGAGSVILGKRLGCSKIAMTKHLKAKGFKVADESDAGTVIMIGKWHNQEAILAICGYDETCEQILMFLEYDTRFEAKEYYNKFRKMFSDQYGAPSFATEHNVFYENLTLGVMDYNVCLCFGKQQEDWIKKFGK